MNPLIDMGQSQGAFVMGLGYYLQEKLEYDPTTGENLTAGTWEYHPPTSKDIPVDFRISFLKDTPNPLGVLGAKGEGPESGFELV
jgi:xanthine dehydrogenase/oxidase